MLLKVPFNQSLDSWVLRERQVLADLAGVGGVPEVFDPLYFEDA